MILETAFYLVVNAHVIYDALLFKRASEIYKRITVANKITDAPAMYEYKTSIVNAMTEEYQDGNIYITDGILEYAHNDDEVALVLAHELGHWVHRGREVPYYMEYWADSFGSKAIEIAGYDRCRGAQVMWRFDSPDSYSHPPSDKRWLAMTQGCYGPANRE